MPKKIEAHDKLTRFKMGKLKKADAPQKERARKYRSSYNWQKVVKMQKKEYPFCCDPFNIHKNEGRMVPMDEVHHVKQLVKRYDLRNYPPNLRSICTKCHHKISMMERRNEETEHYFQEMPEM